MADEEKTEEATGKKRGETYEQGQMPRSAELATAMMLLVAAFSVQTLSPGMARAVRDIFGAGLYVAGAGIRDPQGATALLVGVIWKTLAAMMLVLCVTTALVAFTAGVQGRGVLSLKPLAPKFSKLNPINNAKRFVSSQPWADLAKSMLKLLLVAVAVYMAFGDTWTEMLALSQESPWSIVSVTRRYSARMLFAAGLCYLVLAVVDYLYQVWSFEKGIRMSKHEVKQEHKQSEGDPMTKARIRSFGRQLVRRKMFRDVKTADVVIANPTHIAIALRYDPEVAPAPFVLAMGERKVAERIKRLAYDNGVPVIENRPLARALLASAQVGTIIPAELYAAVAEVLAFVFKQRAMAPRSWSGSARG